MANFSENWNKSGDEIKKMVKEAAVENMRNIFREELDRAFNPINEKLQKIVDDFKEIQNRRNKLMKKACGSDVEADESEHENADVGEPPHPVPGANRSLRSRNSIVGPSNNN